MQSQKVMQYNVVNAPVLHAASACMALLQQCIFNKYNFFNLAFSVFDWIFYVIPAHSVLDVC